jgi:protein-tyrosine kinase
MSRFFDALEQAERDRARRGEADPRPETPMPCDTVEPMAATRESRGPRASTGEVDDRLQSDDEQALEGFDDRLLALLAPAGTGAGQLLALGHALEEANRRSTMSVVAVSSAATGDGKTLLSLGLAGALARPARSRVLLVEADLRQPSVGRYLRLDSVGGRGLAGALARPGLTLARVSERVTPLSVDVVLAGHAGATPYDLLQSPRLGELMSEARQHYDYVVVDTPPLTPFHDCRLIGRFVDGFVLVVAANRTPRKLVEEALALIEPSRLVAVVFNGDEEMASRYHAAQELTPSARSRARWRTSLTRVGIGTARDAC